MGLNFTRKTLFALVASAILAVALCGTAFAKVSLGEDSVKYPTQLNVPRALQNAGEVLDVTNPLGIAKGADSTLYVRYDLSTNAVFNDAPAWAVTGATTAVIISNPDINFAVFEVYGPALASSASTELNIPTDGIFATNQSAVTIAYSVYLTESGAINGQGASYTKSGTYLQFTNGLATSSGDVDDYFIDVGSGSKAFAHSSSTTLTAPLGYLAITATAGLYDPTGDALTYGDMVKDGILTVTGDFSATDVSGSYEGSKVFFGDSACTSANPADTLSGTSAIWDLDGNPITSAQGYVCMTVNGAEAINSGSYTAVFDITSQENYTVDDVNYGVFAVLTKNGSSTDLSFLLTPGGLYQNYVRFTNCSTLAGDVTVTLINDTGDKQAFPLSDVAGFTSSSLGAGASTPLISIEALFDAAYAASGGTFDLTGNSKKLRLVVEGEFECIDAQAFSLSTSGDSFFMLIP